MKISDRIHARKVVFAYYYQHCFFSYLKNNQGLLSQTMSFDLVFPDDENYDELFQAFISDINQAFTSDMEYDIYYMIENQFSEWKNDIDREYLKLMFAWFEESLNTAKKSVDKHATTFKFDEMTVMDQTLFILGIAERNIIHTEKKILISELIQIAQRFSNTWSIKLINWILEKILE